MIYIYFSKLLVFDYLERRKLFLGCASWRTCAIPATQEAEVRRIKFWPIQAKVVSKIPSQPIS
jgi:hypothetical protein